jgi:uncharacterized phage protein (TIGR01671 family)
MREIKFRGKGEKGKWIFGDLNHGIFTGNIFINGCFVDDSMVGQYTGLKDKNGKEIYEGDILNLWRSVGANGELRGEYCKPLTVEYCPLWCQFVVKDDDIKEQFGIWQQFQEFEVIGNIHDNPELAKGAAE